MKKLALSALLALSLFGFDSIKNSQPTPTLKGKVVKAYTQTGYGRHNSNWLFMDIKGNEGKIHKVAIAPTFRISNLSIKEGDEVSVNGFTPTRFSNGVIKAVDIYDMTQKRDYRVSGYGHNRGHRQGHRHSSRYAHY